MKFIIFLLLPTLSFGQYYGEISYINKHSISDLSGSNTYKKRETSIYRFVFTRENVIYYAGVEKHVFPVLKVTDDRFFINDNGKTWIIKIIESGGAVLWSFRNTDTVFTYEIKNTLINYNIPELKSIFVTP